MGPSLGFFSVLHGYVYVQCVTFDGRLSVGTLQMMKEVCEGTIVGNWGSCSSKTIWFLPVQRNLLRILWKDFSGSWNQRKNCRETGAETETLKGKTVRFSFSSQVSCIML